MLLTNHNSIIQYVDTAEFWRLMQDMRAMRTSYKTIAMSGITYHVDIPPEECSYAFFETASNRLQDFVDSFINPKA